MRTLLSCAVLSLFVFLFTACPSQDDVASAADTAVCAKNVDCVSSQVCLDGRCVDLQVYCRDNGSCGLACTAAPTDSGVPATCPACEPLLSCPTPICPTPPPPVVTCPDLPVPVCNCPDIPAPIVSCPLPVCNCPPAKDCPACNCAAIPACSPNLSCPKCPDLINPECRECICQGFVTSLTLTYNGTVTAAVRATATQGVLYSGHVDPGGSFAFTGFGLDMNMGSQITIRACPDTSPATCHDTIVQTDCSNPIRIGTVFGEYVVLGGTSSTNGKFCSP